jgi:hypothetical protein
MLSEKIFLREFPDFSPFLGCDIERYINRKTACKYQGSLVPSLEHKVLSDKMAGKREDFKNCQNVI